MKPDQYIPITNPCQSPRLKPGVLYDLADIRSQFFDLKLKCRYTRQFHFRGQKQMAVGINVHDTPEIKHIAGIDLNGIPAAAAGTDTSEKPIEKTAEHSQPRAVIPSPLAPDLRNDAPRLLCRSIDLADAFILQDRPASPKWITRLGHSARRDLARIRPMCFNIIGI